MKDGLRSSSEHLLRSREWTRHRYYRHNFGLIDFPLSSSDIVMVLRRTIAKTKKISFLFWLVVLYSMTASEVVAGFPATDPIAKPTNLLKPFWRAAKSVPAAYSHCLTHHHLATECVTAGVMAGLGDYLAQRQQTTAKKYNPRRTIHFILKGFGEGIMWSFWYHQAEGWVSSMTNGALGKGLLIARLVPVFRTICSLLLDLLVACPLIYGMWDIPFPALMAGMPLRQIPQQIRSKLGTMMMASAKLWTPVNILIYNSPLQYRVLIMAIADVFWQSIVSSIASVATKEEEDAASSVHNQHDEVIQMQEQAGLLSSLDHCSIQHDVTLKSS